MILVAVMKISPLQKHLNGPKVGMVFQNPSTVVLKLLVFRGRLDFVIMILKMMEPKISALISSTLLQIFLRT